MATRLYLTRNPAPLGAPTTSKVAGEVDSGGTFAGEYTPPIQGGEGWATRLPAHIPSYSLTAIALNAGSRSNIRADSGPCLMNKVVGQSVATFLWHLQQAAGAVFSVRLDGVSSLSGAALLTGGMTRNVVVGSWRGKPSYYDDTLGPGGIGCVPRLFYVYRPSSQGLVGVLAEAFPDLHNWTHGFDFGRKTNDFYAAGAMAYSNNHAMYTWGDGDHYFTVNGIEDGDLLCAEYWCGRTFANGTWGFDPWDKNQYPDSVDGDLTMSTVWHIPVGGADDVPLNTVQMGLGNYRSFFESVDNFGVVETPPRRSPQTSVGF